MQSRTLCSFLAVCLLHIGARHFDSRTILWYHSQWLYPGKAGDKRSRIFLYLYGYGPTSLVSGVTHAHSRSVTKFGVVSNPIRTYDVLNPVIQTKEEGFVEEQDGLKGDKGILSDQRRRPIVGSEISKLRLSDTQESLQAYARHLLETLEPISILPNGESSPRLVPLSPSKVKTHNRNRSRVLSPSTPARDLPDVQGSQPSPAKHPPEPSQTRSETLDVPGSARKKGSRSWTGSFVQGDDELVEEGGEEVGCGEAVEILSRHSPKSE